MSIVHRLTEIIKANPGIATGALREAVPDLTPASVESGVKKLRERGLIRSVDWGRYEVVVAEPIKRIRHRVD
jgi:hypothetical protein